MNRRAVLRLTNFWKEPYCWIVGHDTRGELMREWLDCHRCRKMFVGLDELMKGLVTPHPQSNTKQEAE